MLTVPDDVKSLLHQDTCKKNIRIHFPSGVRSDICNDLIVKDSVSFKESICSQDNLKFGLCESPVFECETVGVGNIKGETIEVTCEIYCDSTVDDAIWQMDLQAWVYPIPYGTFTVSEAKRQADINHRKIIAYRSSVNEWIVSDFEKAKKLAANATTYTPKLFYLANICGFDFGESYFDIVDAETVDPDLYEKWTAFSPMGGGDVPMEYTFTFYFYSHTASNLTPQALYEFQYTGDGNRDEFNDFVEEYLSIFDEYAINKTRALLYDDHESRKQPHPLLEYPMSDIKLMINNNIMMGWFKKPVERFMVYPFVASGRQITDIHLITHVYLEITDEGGNEYATYTANLFDNVAVKKKTIKSAYSYLGAYDAYSIPIKKVNSSYSLPDFDNYAYQDDISSWLERRAYFGYFGRDGMFKLLNLRQQFGLLPSTTLYPSSTLYPEGVTGGKLLPQDYQSCWYDDDYTKPFGAVQCTYTNPNNETCFYIMYLTGFDENTDKDSYRIYDFSNNILAKSKTWTETNVAEVCTLIANVITGVQYMPVEFVGRGLPYVEAGDTFEILTKRNDSITTIVLNRTITGEQTLTDSYKSV